MTDRRVRAALVTVALGAVALGVWMLWPAPPSGEAARTTAPAPAEPADRGTGSPKDTLSRPSVDTSAPLPLPGTPIAQVITALKPRADAGDSRAACRLAVELLRCRHLQEYSQFVSLDGVPTDVALADKGHSDIADQFAEMQIRQIRMGEQCAAIEPALLELADGYLANAAFAGEPEAMVRYATGAHHGIAGSSAFIRDPDFERWRRESPGMLLRAVQAGRLDAVALLGAAYRSDLTPYAGLVADDPVQALAWGIVYSRLSGATQPAFESSDPDIQARASALASQWHASYFNNAVLKQGEVPVQLQPLHLPMRPLEEDRFCEPPRHGVHQR